MIRIGLIGAGPRGLGNMKKLLAHEGRCVCSGIADPMTENAEKAAEELGGVDHIVSDFKDLFEHSDAIMIASPNFLHAEQAIASAEAGKHVFIEKPMAMNLAEADAIVDAITKAGVQSYVGFQVRFATTPRTLKTVFEERDTGDLISIWSRRLCNLYANMTDQRSWRGDFQKSGGVIAELLTHEIDWMCNIAGMPTEVYAKSYAVKRQDPRDNDHLWITYTFANGATGTIEGSQCAPIGNYSKGIVGTKASVSDRNWGGEAHWESPEGHEELEKVADFDNFGNWLDAIEGKAAAETDAKWGRDITLIIERTLDSVASGQPVKIE